MFGIATKNFVRQQVADARQTNSSWYSEERLAERVKWLEKDSARVNARFYALLDYLKLDVSLVAAVPEQTVIKKVVKNGK